MTVVLGVDLSLTASGLAWSTGETETFGRQGLTLTARAVRGVPVPVPVSDRAQGLEDLAFDLLQKVVTREPAVDLVVVENLPTTGIVVVSSEKAYVWWRFVLGLRRNHIPVLDVAPKTAKLYATGRGDANKREVIAAVQTYFPGFALTRYSARGKPLAGHDDNKADAVVLAAIGADLLGAPIADVPARHRTALDKLTLPERPTR